MSCVCMSVTSDPDRATNHSPLTRAAKQNNTNNLDTGAPPSVVRAGGLTIKKCELLIVFFWRGGGLLKVNLHQPGGRNTERLAGISPKTALVSRTRECRSEVYGEPIENADGVIIL